MMPDQFSYCHCIIAENERIRARMAELIYKLLLIIYI